VPVTIPGITTGRYQAIRKAEECSTGIVTGEVRDRRIPRI